MDTSGCSNGMATDRIFSIVRPGMPRCTASVNLFWALVGTTLVLRVLLTVLQVRIALNLTKNRRENQRGSLQARVPATTTLEVIHTIFNLIGWTMFGFDVVNSQNAGGPAVFILIILPFMLGFFLSCLKLVHLGQKIIPRTIRNQLGSGGKNREEHEKLGSVKADKILQALFVTYVIAQTAAIVFQVIIGTTYHPGTTDTWARIGMGLEGLVAICGFLIVFRQTSRVVNYIDNIHKKQMEVINGSRSGVSEKALRHTVNMLKLRAYAVGLSAGSASAFFFVIVSGVFIPWYLLLLILISSVIGTLGTTIMYKPTDMSLCCCNCSTFSPRATDKGADDTTGNIKDKEPIVPSTESKPKNEGAGEVITAQIKAKMGSSVVSPSEVTEV